MIPQGTAPVNSAFFTASIDSVNAATTCEQLSAIATHAVASLEAELSVVTSQLTALDSLIVAPTDLPSVLTWIGNFIAPIVRTQATCTTQVTELTAKLAALTAAIAAKRSTLGCP